MTESGAYSANDDQNQSTEPVDITNKHFDPEKGEWVPDENPLAEPDASMVEEPVAPGDKLAEERAEHHNENATEGR